MLFNIEVLIKHKKENAKFPFHLYKKEKITSIEHIHPQNPPDIDTDEGRAKTWLSNHKKSLQSLKEIEENQNEKIDILLQEIEELLMKFDKEKFKTLYAEIIELYDEIVGFKENELHTLYNLALIDSSTILFLISREKF